MRWEKDLKDNKDNSLYLGRNILEYISVPFVAHRELRSRKTVRFSEQIMSADKYPRIFSRQMATIVYLYNNQINARALIGQSAVGYCAGKPTEKSRVF